MYIIHSKTMTMSDEEWFNNRQTLLHEDNENCWMTNDLDLEANCNAQYTPSQASSWNSLQPARFRLFDDTPVIATRILDDDISSCIMSKEVGSPSSLSISPFMSPDNRLFSPSEIVFPEDMSDITLTPESYNQLMQLTAIPEQELLGDVKKQIAPVKKPTQIRKRLLGYQLGNKSLGSLRPCTEEEMIPSTPVHTKVTVSSTAHPLRCRPTSTPRILRHRVRRRFGQTPTSHRPTRYTKLAERRCKTEGSCNIISPLRGGPFSPSAFLNIPAITTSTPVCLNTANLYNSAHFDDNGFPTTPKTRRGLITIMPETPTPFKDVKVEVDPPLNSRISQFLPVCENSPQSDFEDELDLNARLPFSSFCEPPSSSMQSEDKQKRISTPQKSRTKSGSFGFTNSALADSLISVETPSKSLIGDQSIAFSPPSILKESIHDAIIDCTASRSIEFPPAPPVLPVKQIKQIEGSDWTRVACGQTSVRLELVQQAQDLIQGSQQPSALPRSLRL